MQVVESSAAATGKPEGERDCAGDAIMKDVSKEPGENGEEQLKTKEEKKGVENASEKVKEEIDPFNMDAE